MWGVLRFHDAPVEVQLQPGKDNEDPRNAGTTSEEQHDEKKEPQIVDWHPGYLEDSAKSTFESFNISLDTSTIPSEFGAPAI